MSEKNRMERRPGSGRLSFFIQAGAGPSPMAYRPYVDVDEIRPRIIPNAAAMEGEGGIANLGCREAGDANIDGFGLDVFAVQSDGVPVIAEPLIRARGAVAADDVDDAVGVVELCHERMQEVKFMHVVITDRARTPVAEKFVEPGDGGRLVLLTDAVDDVEVFASVQVVEVEPVFRGRIARSQEPASAQEQREGGCSEERKLLKQHAEIIGEQPRPGRDWGSADAGQSISSVRFRQDQIPC